MTMKIMKLMMATALATATIIGVFTDPADALVRRRGRRYSRASDVPDLRFSLVRNQIGDDFINDSDTADNFGVFNGAIENFFYFQGRGDLDGDDVFDLTINLLEFDRGNLSAMWNRSRDIIEYTISSPDPVMATVTNDSSGVISNPNYQGDILRFEFDVSGFSEQKQFSLVNDLAFIEEENMFVSSRLQNVEFVRDTFGFDLELPTFIFPDGVTFLFPNEEFPEEDLSVGFSNLTESVPEPSTTAALLTLGTLGGGLLRKRKMI
ncbi:MAG: PEP-CTERM sorting domain-containing protein [Symploca sp. SIO2B6]|nr:PEP-CTERM sorting domain-containing protein [Symploca sp. SIO2B6]